MERPLSMDVLALANGFLMLDILEPSQVLAYVVAQSSLLVSIKVCQFDDPHLLVLNYTMQQGGAKEVVIGNDGVIRLQGWICIPNVDGLRELISEEPHSLRYSIHPCVKFEHQKQDGLTQRLEIPEWKWERLTIDLVVGFPWTLRKYDAVWVTVTG
ncbi:uncharacterized protein LOC142169649 [Nicotiana tabacum]|uniref:Uncharacterized protein LOC142169649 n=1 Tax=Nicotiana tabacum TaxID=4097 RepID=A0AC58SRQ3_TOBAC